MTIEISLLIGILGCASAIYFGLKNNRRNDVSDIKADAVQEATVNVKLDEIGRDVKDIKYDMSKTKEKVDSIDKRLIIVEQSTKSAHKRLDGITGTGREYKHEDA